MLTCSSDKSRNFSVGYLMSRGMTLDEAQNSLGSVAEGVETSRAAYLIAQKYKVDSPIVHLVYEVLYEGKPFELACKELMGRGPSSELRGINE
jgi:glycerol-3-phosphate dehydrogenase (NAD(P)+)